MRLFEVRCEPGVLDDPIGSPRGAMSGAAGPSIWAMDLHTVIRLLATQKLREALQS